MCVGPDMSPDHSVLRCADDIFNNLRIVLCPQVRSSGKSLKTRTATPGAVLYPYNQIRGMSGVGATFLCPSANRNVQKILPARE